MNVLRLAMFALPVVLAGCDRAWTLHMAIAVPAGAQAQAATYPQAVFITTNQVEASASISTLVAGVICEPGADPFDVRTSTESLGLGTRTEVLTAWLEPLPDELAGQPCGVPEFVKTVAGPRPLPAEAWRASATIFEEKYADDSVTLVLAPP